VMAGDVVSDRYELEQLVGSGGMSSVYRAHDRVLERTVALKVLHERLVAHRDVVERFSREAKLVAGLSHHNIVAVIDRGEDGGSPFIVFEYVAGENLKQLVGRSGPLPVERALELGIEIARALSFAHEKGFVHRDVKPQNVLLNGKGEAKVTDFGIARPIEARKGETQTGTVLGTCDYISPEQAQGRHVDELTDVYSLGIVLYELLTGAQPPPARGAAPRRGCRRPGPREGSRGAVPDDGGLLRRARGLPR
jgi:serine/threonine protein kinase